MYGTTECRTAESQLALAEAEPAAAALLSQKYPFFTKAERKWEWWRVGSLVASGGMKVLVGSK